MAAYLNRRKNETDHARLLINFQGRNVPSHAVQSSNASNNRHRGKHYEYHQDSVWGIVESNAAASMASIPDRPGGKRQFLGNKLRHNYRTPFGVAGTPPDKPKSGLRKMYPKAHKEKPRGRRHGYRQDNIHRNRAVAFGNFGTWCWCSKRENFNLSITLSYHCALESYEYSLYYSLISLNCGLEYCEIPTCASRSNTGTTHSLISSCIKVCTS